MKYNLDILNKYIEDGLLECQSHPTLPLKIYNYSRDCQFEKKWDDITLAMRGTVLDDRGVLIAKSYNKFFNIDELQDIPNEEFDVYEKLDGSLGIHFNYKGEWIFASKGSFISEQAIKGKEIFDRKYGHIQLYHTITYIFEIIYPENRIVCHYPEEDVVLTGAFVGTTELNIDYYFFGDKNDKSILYEDKIAKLQATKFGLIYQSGIILPDKTYDVDFCKKAKAYPLCISYDHGFQKNIGDYPLYRCSTMFPCLQFALWTGATKIYVVGMDCTEVHSFMDNRVRGGGQNLMAKMPEHLGRFKHFKASSYPKATIIHINPVNIKRVFDKDIKI
jgi:hypothetical protein